MPREISQIEADMRAFARLSNAVKRRAISRGGKAGKASIVAAAQASRFRGRLSHFAGGKGATLKVSTRSQGDTVVLTASPAGAWGITEVGARPHAIPSRGEVHRLLSFGPGQVVVGPVTHPGVGGAGVWSDATRDAEPAVFTAMSVALNEALDAAWQE